MIDVRKFLNSSPKRTKWDAIRWKIKDLKYYIPFPISDFWHKHIRTIYHPHNNRLRNTIPKTWMDKDAIFENVSFEIIKSFYEDEYKADIVDWENTPNTAKFIEWLEGAYRYVTEVRPFLLRKADNAYPNFDKMTQIETEITNTDTKVLKELVEWRKHLWT